MIMDGPGGVRGCSQRVFVGKGRDSAVKKVLSTAGVIVVALGLVVASAVAGPGTFRQRAAGRSGELRAMARTAVPFAAQQVMSVRSKAQRAHEVPSAPPPSPLRKLSPHLAEKMGASAASSDKYEVVVTTSVDPAELKEQLAGMEIRHVYRKALYGFAGSLTQEEILGLRDLAEVESIGEDAEVHTTVDNAGRWSGATKAREDYGLTGDGDGFERRYTTRDVVIAVLDTGIDATHRDLKGKVVGWRDFVMDQPHPYDDNGHGTHVAGTAAGAGVTNRSMAGVAPGAALVGVKVLDANGAGTYAGVIAGVDWVVENRDRFNIRVMNLSLSTSSSSDGMDALSRAVNGAVEAGILAVVAAGNSGPDDYTIGSPAAAARALTICAMRDVAEGGWSLAPFSSRGPTADGRAKPDLCAPGVRISAPQAGTPDRFVTYSGSSMASPFVAGAAALLLESNPFLTPHDLRSLLISTAQDWGKPGPDLDYGAGRINVYRAIQRSLRLPGAGPVNPTHAVGVGELEDGGEVWYQVEVRDPSKPIAATLLMTDTLTEFYDFDLFLYDADGNELAVSMDIYRQESIHHQAVKPGTYYLLVQAYEGAGPYTLDVSWK